MDIKPIRDWMLERHRIYKRRIAGEQPPWTDDPVLHQYRFCNVFRELDTVTQWIDKHIRQPYADHEHLWIMLAIARTINRTDTLAELIGTEAWPDSRAFTPEKLGDALQARANRKQPVYTGAYLIRAESNPNKYWFTWSKHHYVAGIVIGRLWEDRHLWKDFWRTAEIGAAGLQDAHQQFQPQRYIGWGPFMAYEVVTDLRHTRYLHNAPDIYSWANAGPGAIRGLNRLTGRPYRQGIKPRTAHQEMFDIMVELNELDDPAFNDTFGQPVKRGIISKPRFEMRDIEHSLCETDKWLRVKNGEGRPRSKYNPNKASILTN